MKWVEAWAHLRNCGYSVSEATTAMNEADALGNHAITDPDRIGTPWLVCDEPHIKGKARSGRYHVDE